MKNIFLFTILLLSALYMNAQTMKWIPLTKDMATGECFPASVKDENTLNYGLQYTPNVSGILTSYTTGFYVSCTSHGSPIAKNQSCGMVSNVRVLNACDNLHKILVNSSGNSGTSIRTTVEAGVPVILHQIWVSIPVGESITIEEDPFTDLTTSIDVSGGGYATEYPAFTTATVKSLKTDDSRPIVFLDFSVIHAGTRTAQLDWTTSDQVKDAAFVIERSTDGNLFTSIGSTTDQEKSIPVYPFQFFDKNAMEGDNYYRLAMVNSDGHKKFSPVRKINFSANLFSVRFFPNPANDFLEVNLQSSSSGFHVWLLDAAGQVVLDDFSHENKLYNPIDVKRLVPGIYTIRVETDKDVFTDKVTIAH
ncbi:MAG: T9SS type A sorting domain-containing protein [Saprospiraceae bacterium]